jgi:hypothetical protein
MHRGQTVTGPSRGAPITRRFTEQRWLLDSTIRAVSVSAVCPRARVPHDLRGGVADVQDAVHSQWEGCAEKIRAPSFCVAGEFDELSPLEHTERLISALGGRLVIYQDSRHSVGNVPAANLEPSPPGLMTDWMAATLGGQPCPSERWCVEASGRVVKTPL